MRHVLTALLILVAIIAGREFYLYCDSFVSNKLPAGSSAQSSQATDGSAALPGMPATLEGSLAAAKSQGNKTFKRWIEYYGPNLSDPRKAAIQLDYVIMISGEDMAEARRVFAEVKARTPASSPIFPRIKKLEKAYE